MSEGRGRTTHGRLTADRICAAALAIIDEEGLPALNIRRLAAALDVDPMAIYRVVAAGLESAPVTAADGTFLGFLPSRPEPDAAGKAATAGDLAVKNGPVIASEATLDTAIELLALSRATWAPGVAADGRLVGTATSRRLLQHYMRLVHTGMRRLDALAGRGTLFGGRVEAGSDAVERRIDAIAWPPRTFVPSVRRGDETLFATPEMQLRRGDDTVVVTPPERMDALCRLLASRHEEIERETDQETV